jgi:uncharacterized membrane protein YhaH (DUF805 family)/ribosomal protein S27AE
MKGVKKTENEQKKSPKSLWKWHLKCWKQYADFKGRAQRKEYWSFYLFYSLGYILCAVVSAIIDELFDYASPSVIAIPFILYILATTMPYMAVTVRRLHDSGQSGCWVGVAIILWLITIYYERTGKDSSLNSIVPPLLYIILALLIILVFVFTLLNSQRKTNKWGANPKGVYEQNKKNIEDKVIKEVKQCPFCGEEILAEAKKCKHCGEWLNH